LILFGEDFDLAAGVARAHACARAWAWAGGRQIEILAEQDQ
jgi:hypothetical protein